MDPATLSNLDSPAQEEGGCATPGEVAAHPVSKILGWRRRRAGSAARRSSRAPALQAAPVANSRLRGRCGRRRCRR